jgi:hypothetical protein
VTDEQFNQAEECECGPDVEEGGAFKNYNGSGPEHPINKS